MLSKVGNEPPKEIDLPYEGLQFLDVSWMCNLKYSLNSLGIYPNPFLIYNVAQKFTFLQPKNSFLRI